jgi:hypothetical protein
MLPIALMTGCSTTSSPTSNNNPTATVTFTPTNTPITPIPTVGPAALALGAASSTGAGGNFSVLAGSSITDVGYPLLSGNVGGATNAGYASGTDGLAGAPALFTSTGINANQYWTTVNDPHGYSIAANVAIFGSNGAYTLGAAETGHALANPELGGTTLAPGVYTTASTLTLGSASAQILTLDNTGGNPNNCYIFVGTGLTTSGSSSMTLMNVKAANVFWVIQGSASLSGINSGSVAGFIGTLMCGTSITFLADYATLEGHAFCSTGQITFARYNEIYYP